jgi:ferric-dicitrate binding protein FerR (iron transport regulator)
MTNRAEETNDDAAFEAAITRALEQQPSVAIPAEFAARVRASLPAQPKVRARRSVGRIAATAAAAGLVVALWWLAPHVRPSFASMAFDMELLLLAELAGVAAWLATQRHDA